MQLKIKELEIKNGSISILLEEKSNEHSKAAGELMKLSAQHQRLCGKYDTLKYQLNKSEDIVKSKEKIIESLHLFGKSQRDSAA